MSGTGWVADQCPGNLCRVAVRCCRLNRESDRAHRVVGVEQLEVQACELVFRGGRLVRRNDLMMREALRFHASASPLDCPECFGHSALIAERSEISCINDAQIVQQVGARPLASEPCSERIEEIRALLVEVVRCLHIPHPRHDFRLDSEIPRDKVQFIGNVLVGLDCFVDRGIELARKAP